MTFRMPSWRPALALLALSATLAGCATGPGLHTVPAAGEPPAPPTAAVEPVVVTAQATVPVAAPAVLLGAPSASPIRARFDSAQDETRGDLWQRLRQGYALPDIDGDLVRKWEQWYASRPDYVQRMTERGGRYLFHIVEEIERRGMPADLALLPFIESAFNPQAMSSARAAGMWQFMPATGRDFELRQNVFRDDRRDVLASTRAALDYLQLLYTKFGDWHLALAAYNWGQGNVQRAIQRNEKAGQPGDYLSLRMPDETRNYVPKLQAVKNIVARPQHFALTLPALENHPFFLTVAIDRDIDVALAAELAGLPLDEFKHLNPQLNKPVILAAGTPQVLLPYDNANRFLSTLATRSGPLASWTAWVAPTNLKPADAARQVGMSDAWLREINLIPPGMVVKAGSTLLVPRALHNVADVSGQVADQATLTLAPEGKPLRRVSIKAGAKGDSVAAVARRYRLHAEQVAAWNGVGVLALFKPGHAIVVMLPPLAPRAAAKPGAKPGAKPAAKAAAQRPSHPPAARATHR